MAIATPDGYRAHDETTLAAYLGGLDDVRQRLGGVPSDWQISEVGDGNLNLVFIVNGPDAGVVVKQALPYVRLVGESWPLPLSRAHFENLALSCQAEHAPGLVPTIYYYDATLSLIVMELLQPHIIMRQGMIKAIRYPQFAEHLSTFIANTLFFTSDLALTAAQKKAAIAEFCDNTALCKITEDLIFTDPYRVSDNNRWTSPHLDADAAALRVDADLKVGVSELKIKFLSSAEALIHGDLHTGSIMVTEQQTRVIDPEFAFYGPMGFDIGAVLANLLLNYFSQDGHASDADPRDDYQQWVLTQVEAVWSGFEQKFLTLWDTERRGDGYPGDLFDGNANLSARRAAQQRYMQNLLADSLGFAGAKMIRRLVGLAHNIDLEWIEDPSLRARCERRGLRLGRELIVRRADLASIGTVIEMARTMRDQTS